MTNIEYLQRDIKLLQLCIDNSPGQIMPNCDTPEIRELFDEITEGVLEDWKEVRWWALEDTSIPAKELQIQLMRDEIAKEERILKRIENGGTFFELAEEPQPWGSSNTPIITESYSKNYSKKDYSRPAKDTKPKWKNTSSGPSFGDFNIDDSDFEVIVKASKKKEQEDEIAPSFDDLGWD